MSNFGYTLVTEQSAVEPDADLVRQWTSTRSNAGLTTVNLPTPADSAAASQCVTRDDVAIVQTGDGSQDDFLAAAAPLLERLRGL